MKRKNTLPEINQLVVVSHALDATIYRVKAVDGKRGVGVIDATLNRDDQAIMWHDISIFKGLTIGQLKQFTAAQG